MNLGEALWNADSLPWTHAMYAPVGADFGDERIPVLVWDVDDVVHDGDHGDDRPEAARALDYEYVLGVLDLQSIVANAREQKPELRTADLLVAFPALCSS